MAGNNGNNGLSLKSISTTSLLNSNSNSNSNSNISTPTILNIPSPLNSNSLNNSISYGTINSNNNDNINNHNNNTLMLMNKQVTKDDSLYYICLNLKKKLENVNQLKPYLNLAYSSAEVLSENQALNLSQQQKNYSSINGSNQRQRSSSSFRSSNGSNNNNFRVSSYSNFSSISEENSSQLIPSLNTFHAGVLPANINCDPVTQLWALFQQGSPLCVIFNLIKPNNSLPVISSDDLKTCKKSIYDFILACKNHLNFDNSDLFTISNVFSNETSDLIKIIKVINQIIDLSPNVFAKPNKNNNNNEKIDEEILKINDSKSKVLKEIVETERKYVYDLEILSKYKEQLLNNNIINSDDLYMLLPNLDDILDFQRRVLISLEINSLVDSKYQRIGSIFIHAQSFFKLYIPWSVGQKAAIDFISSNSFNLKKNNNNSNLIIENDLELQSFLIKPVQRLCKYPLLLKELIKYTDQSSSSNYNELLTSLEISKSIANDINENQRRVENVEVLKKLYDKVIDWKGYNVNSFGELLFFDKVLVKDNSKNSEEREFQVYLFENIIIFFKEIFPPQQKKSSITSLKKKSQTNLLIPEIIGLELKGRISIANIYNINTINPYQLNISWSGMKDTGSFLMKFKNDEIRSNWESCIRKLIINLQDDYNNQQIQDNNLTNSINNLNLNSDRRSNGISLNSNRSSYIGRIPSDSTIPTSSSSSEKFQVHSRQKSEIHSISSKRTTQDSLQNSNKRSISESYKNSIPNNSIIVKLIYEKDLFTMMISLDINVDEFLNKVEKKVKQCGGVMKNKVKYQDEDGDFIVIQSEEDWGLVKDMLKEMGDLVLNVWVS
ncbi:hypothetical protein WICMUC_000921 [Wickerhamomyces mucosus]|uniref:DH domain-containing protein n=1 Tax=Wickerhamomyces mucosus TaxID=1378264 RepID=A0A9P8PW91_9ASCO|nr:hypothetical protein WICMUC_000921 [Wickerhamomyces mucosus]